MHVKLCYAIFYETTENNKEHDNHHDFEHLVLEGILEISNITFVLQTNGIPYILFKFFR